MKMTIKAGDYYKTVVETQGDITLENVYNGIGIITDQGLFGIAQRDGGLEVLLDGKAMWSSTDPNFGVEVPDRIAYGSGNPIINKQLW